MQRAVVLDYVFMVLLYSVRDYQLVHNHDIVMGVSHRSIVILNILARNYNIYKFDAKKRLYTLSVAGNDHLGQRAI